MLYRNSTSTVCPCISKGLQFANDVLPSPMVGKATSLGQQSDLGDITPGLMNLKTSLTINMVPKDIRVILNNEAVYAGLC